MYYLNLFLGLNKRTSLEKLREAFSQFGQVVDGLSPLPERLLKIAFLRLITVGLFCVFTARVATDRVSGYSKGFGFVRYATIEEAEKGRVGMDGKVSSL